MIKWLRVREYVITLLFDYMKAYTVLAYKIKSPRQRGFFYAIDQLHTAVNTVQTIPAQ